MSNAQTQKPLRGSFFFVVLTNEQAQATRMVLRSATPGVRRGAGAKQAPHVAAVPSRHQEHVYGRERRGDKQPSNLFTLLRYYLHSFNLCILVSAHNPRSHVDRRLPALARLQCHQHSLHGSRHPTADSVPITSSPRRHHCRRRCRICRRRRADGRAVAHEQK